MTKSKRIYVLDTNVLMHDPTALFKFEEHDVYLPMQVIEELDHGTKGTKEDSCSAWSPDTQTPGAILALQEPEPDASVVFVSKDINLRIKAAIAGIVSEDY